MIFQFAIMVLASAYMGYVLADSYISVPLRAYAIKGFIRWVIPRINRDTISDTDKVRTHYVELFSKGISCPVCMCFWSAFFISLAAGNPLGEGVMSFAITALAVAGGAAGFLKATGVSK